LVVDETNEEIRELWEEEEALSKYNAGVRVYRLSLDSCIMSIVLHTGRPGTGKTYNLTRDVLKALDRGRIVYSNYRIFWEGAEGKIWNWKKFKFDKVIYPKSNLRYWNKLSDLFEVEEGIIVMDEAHIYMRSRNWEKLPEEMERKLSQHRKDGLHIWGTVQAVQRIDVIFRELVDYWYVYENKMFWFVRWEFDIDQDKTKKFALSKKWIWKDKKIYEFYDTLEKITVGK